MAKKTVARTTKETHKLIADKVIKAMETSGTDWVKSWTTPTGQLPTSLSTGKQYNGINLLILGIERAVKNYNSNYWATFQQWKKRNCVVKKGEKATLVILYKPIIVQDEETGLDIPIRLVKGFPVFNATQVSGWIEPTIENEIDHTKLKQPETLADQLASRAGCDVRFEDQANAFYVPSHDFVNMPLYTQFNTAEDYAATLLHELTHWTGHANRCDRNFKLTKHGSKDYAKEELVAELGAAMMCGSLGITPAPREDHAKYLASWMQRLKDEPKVIFSAAAKANQAAEWIFNAAQVQQEEIQIAA